MEFKQPNQTDEQMIEKVIAYAQDALDKNQVGVVALLAWNDQIIFLEHNQFAQTQNHLAHAEMVVLNQAAKYLTSIDSQQKSQLTLYSTLEPCKMSTILTA